MIYGFGPRARRVYTVIRDRISRGDWAPGERLPSHRELAAELGVAPLTVRQVLAQLEEQGLVSRQVGRGTFIRQATSPTIAVIGTDATAGAFLAEYVRRAGYRALVLDDPAGAFAAINGDQATVLVLFDVDGQQAAAGIEAIRAFRSGRPHLPIAAVVADLDVLRPLFGTSEWPLQVLPKPVNLGLLDELLRLTACQAAAPD
jgi:DNA-binding transcriptional regulator YhcF (GntR family)